MKKSSDVYKRESKVDLFRIAAAAAAAATS